MGAFGQRRWWFSGTGLAALLVVLVAGAGLIQHLPYWRADLTEDALYTLSPGSRKILAEIDQPITLSLFFSEKVAREFPQQRDFARRVRELLNEYVLYSDGRLKLEIIDPEPFSEAEDLAAEAGLQGVPGGAGSFAIYFGLLGKNAAGDEQVISFFNLQREAFLEYDISQLVYRLNHPQSTVVGVIASVDVFGGSDRGGGQPWLVIEQLRQLAEVRDLGRSPQWLDTDVEVLVVIHPRDLDPGSRYAIDQFVLRGGKALVFVDPHAEVAAAAGMAGPAAGSSDLPALLAAWGVSFDAGRVIGDSKFALRLAAGDDNLPLPHVGILGLQDEALHGSDIITADLENINVATAGSIAPLAGATTTWLPLLSSSDMAMPMASERFAGLRDHGKLLRDFVPSGERYTLAARVRGPVRSAFAGGRPPPAAGEGGADSAAAPAAPHLHESVRDINIIVVADTDMLTDRLWVQVSNFFGRRVAAPWANNGAFVINAVENLGGSADLVSVRSRGSHWRRFEVVDELQRRAAERFQQQEQLLLGRLEELESKIQQLSHSGQGEMLLELSDAQRHEVRAFERQRLAVRKQLRQVQHQLHKDIETLEANLMLINTALVPGVLTLAALVLAWVRGRRRRSRGGAG